MKKLYILGTRGIPAQHGGFETFAEKLSLHLSNKGWDITVYCQEESNNSLHNSVWEGIKLIHIPITQKGAIGTILFDWKATLNALSKDGLFLTLGYNTAVFNILQRFKRQINLINMDGIEWRRDKWAGPAKLWFWLNERIGSWAGNHLIADHPKIKEHLSTRVNSKKITMIPYGADVVLSADKRLLSKYNLTPRNFSIIIARPEPENSIFEMVSAFSRKIRNHKLVVLGNFTPQSNDFHKKVIDVASSEVIFPGAIYEQSIVQSLRFYSQLYLHGHRVGGTNPSLVEAMGAGCAVLAHDNHFNRWVAGEDARYFKDENSCSLIFDELIQDNVTIDRMKDYSKKRHAENFTWEQVLLDYESLLTQWYPNH